MKSIYVLAVTVALLSTVTLTSGQQSELVQPPEWWQVHPRPIYADLEKVGTYQKWFDVYKLTEGTFAIYDVRRTLALKFTYLFNLKIGDPRPAAEILHAPAVPSMDWSA